MSGGPPESVSVGIAVAGGAAPTPGLTGDPAERDWVSELRSDGPVHEAALRDVHALLLRACRHQVWQMRGLLPRLGAVEAEELVNGAADEALVHLLGRLDSFEGRARFTTWAYKFAILQTANEVRRRAWASTEVSLSDDLALTFTVDGPEARAEANDLGRAVVRALAEALTSYQRRIAIALLVDEVPVDVLAERLGTTRGALYKTLHVARSRIRAHLVASGHLPGTPITIGGTQ
jgi:RNA polymerase sigma-70 factor (ECF subfamily)